MFKSLSIKNFQPFTSIKVDFKPGLNVIVGPNGCGKSSILRAIRWVVRDAFRGTFFIHTGTSDCSATITTDNDEIQRRVVKSPSGALKVNSYEIVGKESFSKHKGVPEEVTRALDVSLPLQLSKDVIDLNFAEQHTDAVFLLNRPGSVAARLLSRIVNLDMVLEAMRNLSSKALKHSRDIKSATAEASELQKQIDDFPVLTYDRTFNQLDAKVKALDGLRGSTDKLTRLSSDLSRIGGELAPAKSRAKELSSAVLLPFVEVQEKLFTIGTVSALRDDLRRVLGLGTEASREVEATKVKQTLYSNFIAEWEDRLRAIAGFNEVEAELSSTRKTASQLKDRATQAEEDYHNLLHELRVCPLCGQETSN